MEHWSALERKKQQWRLKEMEGDGALLRSNGAYATYGEGEDHCGLRYGIVTCPSWYGIVTCPSWYGIVTCPSWYGIVTCPSWYGIVTCPSWYGIVTCPSWYGIVTCPSWYGIVTCPSWYGIVSCPSWYGIDVAVASWMSADGSIDWSSRFCIPKLYLYNRNTNPAQPATNNLKMIFAIKQGILVNWPAKFLKVMFGIATSSSRLLAYWIFISRVIDYMEIDTSDVEIKLTNTHDHQLCEYLIHKMGIYKIIGIWMYQEDYRTTVDLDQHEQPIEKPEAPEASQTPPFGLAPLDALEQHLN
ncbi:hypothetical protein Lal_00042882 [Lupinus albus]|nr:hypothetical protein Lal_00042882 [Lupinus albus]